jgi:hypothetical protein
MRPGQPAARHAIFHVLLNDVTSFASFASKSTSVLSANTIRFCVQTPGMSRKLTFVFQLAVSNSLSGSNLTLIEYNRTVVGRGHDHRVEFHFDFGPSGEYGWRSGTKHGEGNFCTTRRFADDQAKNLIDALSANPCPRT